MEPENEKFRTPDEVAADEQLAPSRAESGAEDASLTSAPARSDDSGKQGSRWSKWNAFNRLNWPPGKKEWIIIVVLVLLIAGGVAFALLHKPKPATLQPIPKVTDASKTVPSTLTGLPVDPSVNKRTVTGVMIENSEQARPQAGLGQAGVVFEAIAEAGITRFLALYQDTAPNNVGPIRSARPYFIRWNLAFDAGYAHVGGSPEALSDINNWNVRDLNQAYNGNYYHRVGSRPAPHNVYTSIAELNKLEVAKGYETSHFTGFVRKAKAWRPKNQPITAGQINFAISQAAYDVHYNFDPKTDSYARKEGGVAHIDSNTNKQIKPVVVIAMVIPYALESDGYHSAYSNLGSGQAFIFQDGKVINATWAKSSNQSQLTFKDAKGKPIQLNPGQTWLTAVASASQVTYAP
ncbi:MAG TPA: DUF3048 domain-containing protein [Candidatus Saccharimonadales bacterium]|nr:DUF3048 domain-containing protein [Candidatus Saccharimonadales bacterium]